MRQGGRLGLFGSARFHGHKRLAKLARPRSKHLPSTQIAKTLDMQTQGRHTRIIKQRQRDFSLAGLRLVPTRDDHPQW